MAANEVIEKIVFKVTGAETISAANAQLKTTASTLTNISVAAGAAAAAGVLALGQMSGAVAEYSKNLGNVGTLLEGDVKRQISDFDEQIRALSPELGSAAKNTDALYQALSAGAAPAKAVGLVTEAAKTARAGLADTFQVVDAGTTIMNTFGSQIGSTQEIFDQMFQVVKLGKITIDQYAGSISGVVSTAATAGVKLSDLNAAISTLTAGGISADESVTALNQMILSIIKPSEGAAKMAEQLGIQFNLTALQSKGLVEFMQELRDATGGNIEKMTEFFPNIRALKGALALTGEQMQKFVANAQKMENSVGSVDKAFATATDNYAGHIDKMTETYNRFVLNAGKALEGFFDPLVQIGTIMLEFLNNNATLVAGMTLVGTAIAGLTAVVTGLGAALATFALSWGAIQTAFATTAAFVTTVLGPALLAIAPWVAGIGAAIAGVIVFWDELKFVTQAAAGAIQLVVTSLVEGIRYLFEDIATYIHDEWPMAFQVIDSVVGFVTGAFEGMKITVVSLFEDIGQAASDLRDYLDPIVEAIKVIAGSDLYEDFRGEKMTGKTSATTKAKSTTQTSFASAFGESLAANPSKAFDAWAETAQGQGMLREDPSAFYALKSSAASSTATGAVTGSTSEFRSYALERDALEAARADLSTWSFVRRAEINKFGSSSITQNEIDAIQSKITSLEGIVYSSAAKNNVSLDSTSVTALASAMSTNGATYQKTRYAY